MLPALMATAALLAPVPGGTSARLAAASPGFTPGVAAARATGR